MVIPLFLDWYNPVRILSERPVLTSSPEGKMPVLDGTNPGRSPRCCCWLTDPQCSGRCTCKHPFSKTAPVRPHLIFMTGFLVVVNYRHPSALTPTPLKYRRASSGGRHPPPLPRCLGPLNAIHPKNSRELGRLRDVRRNLQSRCVQ